MPSPALTRGLLVAGVAVFTLLGAGMLIPGSALLDWPQAQAGALILAVEAAATVSIAVGLTVLFAGGTLVQAGATRR